MIKQKSDAERVYAVVKAIPAGRVLTYKEVAVKAGLKSPRTVGMYLHKNSDPNKIPCHRVVFSDGSLSNAYAFGGQKVQYRKLRGEGVMFKGKKAVR